MRAQPITLRSSRTLVRVCEYCHFVLSCILWLTFIFSCVEQAELCFSRWTAQSWRNVRLFRVVYLTGWCLTFLIAGEKVGLKRTENFSNASSSGMNVRDLSKFHQINRVTQCQQMLMELQCWKGYF